MQDKCTHSRALIVQEMHMTVSSIQSGHTGSIILSGHKICLKADMLLLHKGRSLCHVRQRGATVHAIGAGQVCQRSRRICYWQ